MVNLEGIHTLKKFEYEEGEPCINCECEGDFFSHSDGNQHYYYCEECDTTWYNEQVWNTYVVE
jgi:hypothetical protein|tara:strand:- start:398 stop:586 length:189 start_codon:yes stop_codon:yes gene_type:complete